MEEIHVGTSSWSMAEVEMTFQAQSHDIITKLSGETERRIVPAIKKRINRRFQFNKNAYHIRKTRVPFKADTMETETKIRAQTKPALSIANDVDFLPQLVTDLFDIEYRPMPKVTKEFSSPQVVGRIRHPAELEEYYGECLSQQL